MSPLRTFPSAVVASFALALTASSAGAADPKKEEKGIVVVGATDVSTEMETLARSAYARETLRPVLSEAEVERLAGGDLGGTFHSARELKGYLRAHSLRGAIFVDRTAPNETSSTAERGAEKRPVRVRFLAARKDDFENPPLQPSSEGDWNSALNRVEASLKEQEPTSFYSSGWFWGAIGGAALLGLVVVAAASSGTSSSDRSHLVVRFP